MPQLKYFCFFWKPCNAFTKDQILGLYPNSSTILFSLKDLEQPSSTSLITTGTILITQNSPFLPNFLLSCFILWCLFKPDTPVGCSHQCISWHWTYSLEMFFMISVDVNVSLMIQRNDNECVSWGEDYNFSLLFKVATLTLIEWKEYWPEFRR